MNVTLTSFNINSITSGSVIVGYTFGFSTTNPSSFTSTTIVSSINSNSGFANLGIQTNYTTATVTVAGASSDSNTIRVEPLTLAVALLAALFALLLSLN